MSTYIGIDFDGEYKNLIDFMEDKNWEFEPKRVAKQKAYFKIPEDLYEEISFFKNFQLENSNLTIAEITPITDSEYSSKKVYIEEKPKPKRTPYQQKIDEDILDSERRFEPEEVPFKWDLTKLSTKDIGLNIDDVKSTLPNKAPLSDVDPMKYLTSQNFVKKYMIISFVLLFLMSLFN